MIITYLKKVGESGRVLVSDGERLLSLERVVLEIEAGPFGSGLHFWFGEVVVVLSHWSEAQVVHNMFEIHLKLLPQNHAQEPAESMRGNVEVARHSIHTELAVYSAPFPFLYGLSKLSYILVTNKHLHLSLYITHQIKYYILYIRQYSYYY